MASQQGNYTSANATTTPSGSKADPEWSRLVLLCIYTAVLLSGTLGMVLMVRLLRSHTLSLTALAVLNLVFGHFLFLLTVPFRLHYYATGHWHLGPGWCKAVSSMVHIHLYMSFIFYVVILVTRLLAFRRQRSAPPPEVHCMPALLGSLAVWVIVGVTVPCAVHYGYGDKDNSEMCFKFGYRIKGTAVSVLNYVGSVASIVVAAALAGLQAHVLRLLRREHGQGWRGQQVVWAQLRSLCFAGIMVVCFVPYHMFRLYYIAHVQEYQHVNEVFLSVTALSCLDMLTFVGKGPCVCC
ncbi:hypothetical protein NHX12_021376 [Muraenolepis orangiensis]|uniref:G-protein coupled receptors family 1 profile domain-containing protein n=1 Tax=Muraenolepis orangiensis TaxID=630683 RepID=A0A9Q0ETK0_9TELE|nr:hypothetical protein NHX12_021376 [Muraenolepis orangiensis]